MCGILAIARARRPAEGGPRPSMRLLGSGALELAMSRLRRRGPDGSGSWTSPCGRILLAHTRLAIQDLTDAGRQPMLLGSAADASVAVTYNGEIYNAPALRGELESLGDRFGSRSDTEVLLHGFVRWGFPGLLDRVRGMFALVLIDRREPARPVLHAAVDHAGMKPLVHAYSASSGRLVIASDCDAALAALRDDPDFAARLDGQGLCHVLSLGYCPAPWTVWRGVRKLGPGQRLSWDFSDSPPRIERWWSPPERLDAPTPRDDSAHAGDEQEQFEHLLTTVVREHLISDVPVGLFLSAGIDSSSIALALAGAGDAAQPEGLRPTAYTLGAPGIDPAVDETGDAADLAGRLGMAHRRIRLEHAGLEAAMDRAARAFDEPQGFTALLTATEIARGARAQPDAPKVILGGDGGDEAFAGYAWHGIENHPLALSNPSPGRATPELARRSFTHRALCRVFAGFHPRESRELLSALEPDYDEEVFASWLAFEDRPDLPHPRRSQRLDLVGFCAGSILPKVDRAAMDVALELRSPLLDRRILEWAMTRPVDAQRMLPTKQPLRRFLERGTGAGRVPAAILRRPKQGFSLRLPEARPFTTLAARLLPGSRLVRDGVVRRDFVEYLPRESEAREQRLFTLCMVAAWYEHRA